MIIRVIIKKLMHAHQIAETKFFLTFIKTESISIEYIIMGGYQQSTSDMKSIENHIFLKIIHLCRYYYDLKKCLLIDSIMKFYASFYVLMFNSNFLLNTLNIKIAQYC